MTILAKRKKLRINWGKEGAEETGQKGWLGPRGRLAAVAGGEVTSDVDQVVGDDAQPHPALHALVAAVAATIQSVSPLEGRGNEVLAGQRPLAYLLKPDGRQTAKRKPKPETLPFTC